MPDFRQNGILILHNVPRTGTTWDASDAGVMEEVEAVKAALADPASMLLHLR